MTKKKFESDSMSELVQLLIAMQSTNTIPEKVEKLVPKRYKVLSRLALPFSATLYLAGMLSVINFTNLSTLWLCVITVVASLMTVKLAGVLRYEFFKIGFEEALHAYIEQEKEEKERGK